MEANVFEGKLRSPCSPLQGETPLAELREEIWLICFLHPEQMS